MVFERMSSPDNQGEEHKPLSQEAKEENLRKVDAFLATKDTLSDADWEKAYQEAKSLLKQVDDANRAEMDESGRAKMDLYDFVERNTPKEKLAEARALVIRAVKADTEDIKAHTAILQKQNSEIERLQSQLPGASNKYSQN